MNKRSSWDHDIVGTGPTTFDVSPLLDVRHEAEDDSWSVSVRAMPGHVGAADTLQGAVVEAADAAEAWIAAARQPEPLDIPRLRTAILEISRRHDWEHTTDREDRTQEIAAEYARLGDDALTERATASLPEQSETT